MEYFWPKDKNLGQENTQKFVYARASEEEEKGWEPGASSPFILCYVQNVDCLYSAPMIPKPLA
ncbi:hypothetical protein Taro_005620 [Colocasia esculenta]|uniref:Uncharacterized protein n=1 Tax=Colocasia esculenta TaxID=4460 RepID=A0A843TV83_COLES|nr:hypothetical protein [Colocasia esculenta]